MNQGTCYMCFNSFKKSDLKMTKDGKFICNRCIRDNDFIVCKSCKKAAPHADCGNLCGECCKVPAKED